MTGSPNGHQDNKIKKKLYSIKHFKEDDIEKFSFNDSMSIHLDAQQPLIDSGTN